MRIDGIPRRAISKVWNPPFLPEISMHFSHRVIWLTRFRAFSTEFCSKAVIEELITAFESFSIISMDSAGCAWSPMEIKANNSVRYRFIFDYLRNILSHVDGLSMSSPWRSSHCLACFSFELPLYHFAMWHLSVSPHFGRPPMISQGTAT